MKTMIGTVFLALALMSPIWADSYYATNYYPYAPAAEQPGSSAVYMFSNSIVAWADGYENLQYGDGVATTFRTPELALGPAVGTSGDIVCLGDGGQITLTVSGGIENGAGADFVVFENGFSDTYLELGWVEVSSDGTNFVRYPSYSLNTSSSLDPQKIYGLASKYKQGYGTPFDLSELQVAYDAALVGNTDFSAEFTIQLTNGFPLLDLGHITHVRIVDVIGDGSSDFDCRGLQIYDPVDMFRVAAGFDLDAIGVINQPAPTGLLQTILFDPIPHQKLVFSSIVLDAVSDSGLPVSYSIQSGPAIVTDSVLSFTGTGVVEVVACQSGDATYAPAAPVLRSFVVAEEIQHIFVEPVPNQIRSGGNVQINAYSSGGFPVKMQVYDGPADVLIGGDTHLLDLGNETGGVTLRAYQPGDATYAPAEDVFMEFEIVEAGASNAPLTLAEWAATNSVPADGLADSDGDGVIDFQEFIMGGNPNLGTDTPLPAIGSAMDAYGRPSVTFEYSFDRTALGRCWISRSDDLSVWTNAVPEVLEQAAISNVLHMKVQFPADTSNRFYRLVFEEQ